MSLSLKVCSTQSQLPIQAISEVTFSVLSDEEIKAMSCLEIDNDKQLNSPYLGPMTADDMCHTCHENIYNCRGHYGHIKVDPYAFLHPEIEYVVPMLFSCFNNNQTELIFHENDLAKFNGTKGIRKLRRIMEAYEDKRLLLKPIENNARSKYEMKDGRILKDGEALSDNVVFDMLERLSVDRMRSRLAILGFENVRPSNFIVRSIVVVPPNMRKSFKGDKRAKTLTEHYKKILDVVRGNTNYARMGAYEKAATIKALFKNLISSKGGSSDVPDIKSLVNGKEGLVRAYIHGKRNNFTARSVASPDPLIAIDEVGVPFEFSYKLSVPVVVYNLNFNEIKRLQREGRIESVITRLSNGRKIEFSLNGDAKIGDTVYIAPIMFDNNNRDYINEKIKQKWIVIDHEEFKTGVFIFKPIVVTEKNVDMVNRMQDDHILVFAKHYNIKIGDTVRRRLMNQDVLLLGRQPSLHLYSIFAVKAKLVNGKTVRANPAYSTGF